MLGKLFLLHKGSEPCDVLCTVVLAVKVVYSTAGHDMAKYLNFVISVDARDFINVKLCCENWSYLKNLPE